MSIISIFTKSRQTPKAACNALELQMQEVLKNSRRELDKSIKELEDYSKNGINDIEKSRQTLTASLEKLAQTAQAQIKK